MKTSIEVRIDAAPQEIEFPRGGTIDGVVFDSNAGGSMNATVIKGVRKSTAVFTWDPGSNFSGGFPLGINGISIFPGEKVLFALIAPGMTIGTFIVTVY